MLKCEKCEKHDMYTNKNDLDSQTKRKGASEVKKAKT